MNSLYWTPRGASVALCCLIVVATVASFMRSEGQAQQPATDPAQPRAAATQQPGAPATQPPRAVPAQQPGAVPAQPPGAAPAARRMPAPVLSTPDLMRLFNKQVYEYLKPEMAEQPTDEDGWKTIEERGLQTAEVANLVAMRPAKPPQDQWLQAAGNLQAAGIALAEAAKRRDWQKTTEAYQGLIQRCNACHQARAPGKAPAIEP